MITTPSGLTYSPEKAKANPVEFLLWRDMWARVRRKIGADARSYRERGITVCERWRSFDLFLEDMGPRKSPAHSLDRRNNDLGYFPDNCRWATAKEQARNRRNNTILEFNGKRQTIAEWSEELGFGLNVISMRLAKGWSVERALTQPAPKRKSRHRKDVGIVVET